MKFAHLPTYSPDFNLAEYIIHQLRLKLLHHLPLGVTVLEIEDELEAYFEKPQLQSREGIRKTLDHICRMAPQS